MKYIKTKHRIIKAGDILGDLLPDILRWMDWYVEESEIIEDLFDRIVCDFRGHYTIMTTAYLNQAKVNTHNIYGAIWTKKGLRYVAKLNDKGEFYVI